MLNTLGSKEKTNPVNMNRKVLLQIVRRVLLVIPVMLVTIPFALVYSLYTQERAPWVDKLLDWAIDAPITEYERINGKGSFFAKPK